MSLSLPRSRPQEITLDKDWKTRYYVISYLFCWGDIMSIAAPFGLKIAIINRAFRKRLDEKAAAMGLTAVQLRILGSISRLQASGEVEIHQNDLEEIEHITHPAMTKHLQHLERKGFICCVPSSQDRRYKSITCTEQAVEIYKLILAQDAEVFAELCRDLTDEQQKTLIDLADQIIRHIDTE